MKHGTLTHFFKICRNCPLLLWMRASFCWTLFWGTHVKSCSHDGTSDVISIHFQLTCFDCFSAYLKNTLQNCMLRVACCTVWNVPLYDVDSWYGSMLLISLTDSGWHGTDIVHRFTAALPFILIICPFTFIRLSKPLCQLSWHHSCFRVFFVGTSSAAVSIEYVLTF
jgi:hypothetical protein